MSKVLQSAGDPGASGCTPSQQGPTPAGNYLRALALGSVIDAAEEISGFDLSPAERNRAHHLLLAAQLLARQLVADLELQLDEDRKRAVDTHGASRPERAQ